jgi:hypothetical protein
VRIAAGLLIAAMMVSGSCMAVPTQAAPSHPKVAVADNFRADATTAYRLIEPVCGTTSDPVQARRYDPFRARLAALHRRATGTPFQAVLAAAKRQQELMAAAVDCARLTYDAGTVARITKDLATAGQALSRMERAVSSYTERH